MLSGMGIGGLPPYFRPRTSFVMKPRPARSPPCPEQELPGLVVTDRLTSLLSTWLSDWPCGCLAGCLAAQFLLYSISRRSPI